MTCNMRDKHSAMLFFKIITTTSIEAGKLKLPTGFTREHGGDVSNPVFLKPPDDKKWKIHWTKHEDGYIWFEKGWKEFASYYSLDHGHLLLFEYNKHSHFGVHIFDKSTLEIEYPFHGYNDEQNNLDQISGDSVQSFDERTSCKKRKLKSPMSSVGKGHCPTLSSQPSKKLRTCTSGDVGRRSKLPKLPQHVKGHHQSQGEEFDKSTVELEPTSKKLNGNLGGSLECLKRKELTSKITKASNNARTITSKKPSFKVVMKPAYVNYYILVPPEFARIHLKNKLSDMILDVMDGRTWHVKYLLRRRTISAGWKKFVSDNNLKVGDVCVFELTKNQPLSFKVSIFQPGGESDQPHSPPPQDSVQGNGVNGLNPARIRNAENETTITRKGRKATQKRANEFTPENPYFTVNIKPNNWRDYRQDVPSSFVRKHLNNKKHLLLRFDQNELWPVELYHYRKKGSSKLSKGWARFARESKLTVGDVCVFELINKEEDAPVLHVHIFKA